MSVEIIILDPKSGALEFPSPEKSERRYGTFTIEVPASEPFENKIGKPASGYAYVRRCTAYGFLDHSLKEDCDIITISLKGVSNGETKKIHP